MKINLSKGLLKMLWGLYSFLNIGVLAYDGEVPVSILLQKCSDFHSVNETVQEDLWIVPRSLLSDTSSSNETVFRMELMSSNLSWCETTRIINIGIAVEKAELTAAATSTDSSSTFILDNEIEFQDVNGTEFNIMSAGENFTYYSENNGNANQMLLQFTQTGMLSVQGEYFRPQEYCIQRISETELSIKTCEINCEEEKTPCIPICCSINKIIEHNGSHEKCYPSGSKQYTPTFYKDPYIRLTPEEASEIQPHFFKTFPSCEHGDVGWPFRHIQFNSTSIPKASIRVLRNGKVKYLGKDQRWKDLDVDQYCIAGLKIVGVGKSVHYSGNEEDQIIHTCWSEFSTNEVTAPEFYIPTFFVGSFFLFITALVYILLWDQQNVHGWTVLSFVLSNFFMFIFLAWTHLLGLIHHNWKFEGTFFCTAIGIITHFFFLSTFCWLAVINFDMWWTFKSMAPISSRSKGVKRFIGYLTFAWGVPTLICTVGIILQHVFSDPESEVIVPDYGNVNCFLPYTAKGVYLHYIIGFLMVVNLIFMCLTLYTIYEFKKGTRAVDMARSNNSQTSSVRLFVKLFVVMGVTWIFELISWWLSVETTVVYWIIFDMFNLFQSIGIFLIFVCKRKILNQLEQKYPSLKVITGPLKRVTLSRRATRTITTTTGLEVNATRTTAFSGRKFDQNSSKTKI